MNPGGRLRILEDSLSLLPSVLSISGFPVAHWAVPLSVPAKIRLSPTQHASLGVETWASGGSTTMKGSVTDERQYECSQAPGRRLLKPRFEKTLKGPPEGWAPANPGLMARSNSHSRQTARTVSPKTISRGGRKLDPFVNFFSAKGSLVTSAHRPRGRPSC